MEEILNAKITSVSLSMADHGILTYDIGLDFGGSGCMFGGRCIGKGYLGAKSFEGYDKGLEAMMRVMDTVGVEKWEDLNGKYVRAVTKGWGGSVQKIGHILKDKWFDQEEFFKEK